MMLNQDSAREPSGGGDEARILHSRIIEPKKGQGKDAKQKMEIIALIVLSCLFIYLIITTFFLKPSKNKPASRQTGVPAAVSGRESKNPGGIVPFSSPGDLKVKTEEDEGWGRSPFSLLSEDKKGGGLILQGIVESGKEAYALIGQKIVKVGDRIDDKKVKEISNGKVVIEKANGEEIVLKV